MEEIIVLVIFVSMYRFIAKCQDRYMEKSAAKMSFEEKRRLAENMQDKKKKDRWLCMFAI